MQAAIRLVLTALLLLPLASAAASVQGPEMVEACLGSEATATLLVTNADATAQTYGLFTSPSLQEAVTFTPNTLTLQPGAQGAVTVRYRFTERGTFDVPVAIVSTTGERTDLKQEIVVGICNNNYVLAADINQTACPCLPLTYEFVVRNTGDYVETYTFSMDRYAEYGLLSHNPLVLAPGQEETVTLTLQLPCSVHGEQIITFTSRAQTSRIKASVPLIANVQACYDHAIEAGSVVPLDEGRFTAPVSGAKSISVCAGDTASIPLSVSNEQYFPSNYSLTLQGPAWAELYVSEIITTPGGEARTSLDLTVPVDELGTSTLLVTTTSSVGEAQEQLSIDLTVDQCHGLLVELPAEETLCSCTTDAFDATITNTGRFAADVALSVEGTEWTTISPTSLTLESGESAPATLTASLPCETSGEHHVTVLADSARASSGDTIRFDTVALDACYQPEIESSSRQRISYDERTVPVIILNNGVKEATYKISLAGPSWVRTGTEEITIASGSRKTLLLETSPGNASIGDYDVDLLIQSGEVAYETQLTLALRARGTLWDRIRQWFYVYRLWIATGIIVLAILLALGMRARRRLQIRQIRRMIKEGRKNGTKTTPSTKRTAAAAGKQSPWRWIIPAIGLVVVVVGIALLALRPDAMQPLVVFLNTYFWYIIAGLVLLIAIIAISQDR